VNDLLFAGIAMVFWGVAPVLGKLGLGALPPLAALTIRSLIISALLITAVTLRGQWGAVAGAAPRDVAFIGLEGICAALLGQLAYYYALKFGEVGRVSPVAAAFPLVALVLGIVFLGEKVTVYKIAAGFLIVTGLVLMKY
jgi:Predicted membrane protein